MFALGKKPYQIPAKYFWLNAMNGSKLGAESLRELVREANDQNIMIVEIHARYVGRYGIELPISLGRCDSGDYQWEQID